MTTTRGIAPSPSRLSRIQRANWQTAPAVVPAPPLGGLGKGAARFEETKEKAMEAQTITTEQIYSEDADATGALLFRTGPDCTYPVKRFDGAWYMQIDPTDINNWMRFESAEAVNAWVRARWAEYWARIDVVFASLDEAARRIERRCEAEDNSPARIRQEM